MNTPTSKNLSLTARTSWLIFAKTLAFVLGFALPLLLVRRLSQTDFGLYKQAFLVIGTISGILPLGFATSAFYFLPREREKRGAIVLNIILFNCVVGGLAVVLFLLAPRSLGLILNSHSLVPYAGLIGLLILLLILGSLLEIASIANGEQRLATVFIIAAQVLKTAMLVFAAIFFGSIQALLTATVIWGVLQLITLVFYLRSRFGSFWSEFSWPTMRQQLGYGLPFGFSALLYIVLGDLHNYFVSYRFGPAAFALYSIGCFSLPFVGIIGESVGPVLISRVSELQKQARTNEIIAITAAAMRKLAAIYFPLYVLLMVVGREFISFLFTTQYLASWPIFAINLTTLPFLIVLADPIIRSHAEHRFFLLKVRLLTIVVLFVGLWFGTKYFGLLGAITVMVSVNLVDRLIEGAKACSIVNVRWRDVRLLKDVGKLAVAALAAGSLTAIVRMFVLGQRPFVVLVICGLVFSLLYAIFVMALSIPTIEEREKIRGAFASVLQSAARKRSFAPGLTRS
jgi:O-antigen/teichoic acid export membrane protein